MMLYNINKTAHALSRCDAPLVEHLYSLDISLAMHFDTLKC